MDKINLVYLGAIILGGIGFLWAIYRAMNKEKPACPQPNCGCAEADELGPDATGRQRYQCWSCGHVWAVPVPGLTPPNAELTREELAEIRQWAPGQITAEGRRMMQAGLPVLTEEAMTEHHRQLK